MNALSHFRPLPRRARRGWLGWLRRRGLGTLASALLAVSLLDSQAPAAALDRRKVTVQETNYHGWAGSYVLRNEEAEVIVVPAVGRVMQFGFIGEEGVFWENEKLFGQSTTWEEPEWANFGGDKAWPSPEAKWPKFTQREKWKPPPAFDGLPMRVTLDLADLYLTSQTDPFYGVRVRRRVHLHPRKPVLYVQTIFERMSGEPAELGVWVVTQLKDPVALFMPVAAKSIFTNGYALLSKTPPPGLKQEKGLLWLSRATNTAHKIGGDANELLWVGEKTVCRIESPRLPKKPYPDGGCSVEIYTNPDPLKYVELETLGPLKLMKPGDSIQRVNIYTLSRRKAKTAEEEARKLLR